MKNMLRAIIAAAVVCPLLAIAQAYPSKPIRLVIPAPAGSGPDVDARRITQRLSPLLGTPVLIENRPGASTRIAIEAVVKSPPDGYTFLIGTPSLTTLPSLYASLPFDLKRDLLPVSLLSTTRYVLTVNATVPAQNVADFVALTKANPAFSRTGTFGIGTIHHLAGAWFASQSGAKLEFIHYNTSPPFADLASGQTSAIFEAIMPVLGNVKAGRLRMLAITGSKRHPLVPDVATFAEAGIAGFDPVAFIGVLAPAGTPQPIIERVGAALMQVAKMPETIDERLQVGSESIGSTPGEFGAFLDAERSKWAAVIKPMGLRLE